jgi:hypothetical protein
MKDENDTDMVQAGVCPSDRQKWTPVRESFGFQCSVALLPASGLRDQKPLAFGFDNSKFAISNASSLGPPGAGKPSEKAVERPCLLSIKLLSSMTV